MEKQQTIGKSCALTAAASVTAMGEQQDLGTEVFWEWEWSGDRKNTGGGEGAQWEPWCHGAARKCFYWEKSGMALLLLRGSLVLEFGDELGSSAAVTFMEAKSGYPQPSTDFGGAGLPPPKKNQSIRVSGLRSPQRQLLYPSKASKIFLCVLAPPFPCPQLCPTAPRCVLTPCSHSAGGSGGDSCCPPAQGRARAARAGAGAGGGSRGRAGRAAGTRAEPGTAVAKQPLDGSVSPRQRC